MGLKLKSSLLKKLLLTDEKNNILKLLEKHTEGEVLQKILNDLETKKARTSFKCFVNLFYKEVSAGNDLESSFHTDLLIKICQLKANKELLQHVNIVIPPSHTKTTICNVLFTAFLLGIYPNLRIIYGCNSIDEGLKRNQDTINIMSMDSYIKIFPNTILASKTKTWFLTTKGGGRRAVSTDIATRFTGGDADLLLIDDANDTTGTQADFDKVQDWFYKKAERRLRCTKFDLGIFNIQQTTGLDCLACILEKRKNTFTLKLRAIEDEDTEIIIPLREGQVNINRPLGPLWSKKAQEYQQIRIEKPHIWETQYQQNPSIATGALIQYIDISQRYEDDVVKLVKQNFFSHVFISMDTANTSKKTSDYSAFVCIGVKNGVYYILDAFREKTNSPELCNSIADFYFKWRQFCIIHLLIENKSSGISIIQTIQANGLLNRKTNTIEMPMLSPIQVSDSKIDRLQSIITIFKQKRVLLPKTAEWLVDYEKELLSFPNFKNDDWVDATVNGLRFIQSSFLKIEFFV